ncbi:phage late control D family protein [Anaerococcus degeneri]|uniref:Late control protein n=1 Tax=Anaerococcus degeneri TaxID=361500 RepID=A0ABS7Z0I2_9FIRM|nr:contractile injection system protein, VgrG/Pvc8 family [Anaerococcus degeneri]MBP2015699.1 phage protein D [Anaerococcus degeneri]MCA2096061.1 hypothetical protein [Anaerococcus degeneri]
MSAKYARRAKLEVKYDGADISKDLADYLNSLTYTDNEEDESDDLQISVGDKEGRWARDWLKQTGFGKGGEIEASIIQIDEDLNERELKCGKFKVDTVNESGPPTKVTLKASAIPTDSKIIAEEKTKAWENIKLSAIASDIAGKNKLKSEFESEEDPLYDRREQSKKSDIEFLKELCKDAGISLKVTDKKIVLFDASKFEKLPPIDTIKRGESNVLRWTFGTNFIEAGYSKCEVTYTDPKTKETIKGEFKNPKADQSTGRVLKINTKVKDKAEADKLAKKQLREKNKKETQASLEVVGNINYVAGVNLKIDGWGIYDGKYMIQSADHNISNGGYKVSLSLRKVLEGY